jgi:hypothetical protein
VDHRGAATGRWQWEGHIMSDTTTRAAAVLGSIAAAARRQQVVALAHEATGCRGPDCRPCAALARQRRAEDVADYRRREAEQFHEIAAQHRVSATRLAERAARRRPTRDAALIEATQRIAPGAKCVACRTTGAGKVCRTCGTTTTSVAVVDDVVSAVAAGSWPPGPRQRRPGPPRGAAATSPDIPGAGDQQRGPQRFSEMMRALDPHRCRACGTRDDSIRGHICEACSCLG